MLPGSGSRMLCAAVLVTLVPCLPAHGQEHAQRQPWVGRPSFIVDGDSIWVTPQAGGQRQRLRLQGIDAPEICQRGGLQARAALQALVRGEPLRVTVHAHDRFGRAIASVERQRDGLDVAARMVSQGWAWSDAWGWRPGRYAREEADARGARRGVFAEPAPERPADFRRRHGPCDWRATVRAAGS